MKRDRAPRAATAMPPPPAGLRSSGWQPWRSVEDRRATAATTKAAPAICALPLARLVASYRHGTDQDRSTMTRSTSVNVVADGDDVAIYMREISGDRDFLDRVGDLAVFDPVPRRAAGIIPANRIDSLSEQFGHHQTSAHAFEHRGEIVFAVTDDQ